MKEKKEVNKKAEEVEGEVVIPPFYRRLSFWIMTKSTLYALLAPICVLAIAPLLYFGVYYFPFLIVVAVIITAIVCKFHEKLATKSDSLFDTSKEQADLEMREYIEAAKPNEEIEELYKEAAEHIYDLSLQ